MNQMKIKSFLEALKNSSEFKDFNELMLLIDEYYYFTPFAFKNGDLQNQAGENSGSCKLFYFARLHNLTKEETLACFGAYYREDVLKNPQGDNHQNIRNFMAHGWQGIAFAGEVLTPKNVKKGGDG